MVLVGALWGWCVALLLCSRELTSNWLGLALGWNLFLATVPLLWGAAFQSATRRGQWGWAAGCFGLWLLFLPNAPYLLTDLIHLGPRPSVPLWFVLALLLSFAGAGTLLGYLSLTRVHRVVEEQFGATTGWLMAGGALMACGFGIYIGRFLRWNSWDMMTRPLDLLRDIAGRFVDAGPHPHPIPVTLIVGGGLLLGYLALRVIPTAMQAENPAS